MCVSKRKRKKKREADRGRERGGEREKDQTKGNFHSTTAKHRVGCDSVKSWKVLRRGEREGEIVCKYGCQSILGRGSEGKQCDPPVQICTETAQMQIVCV